MLKGTETKVYALRRCDEIYYGELIYLFRKHSIAF